MQKEADFTLWKRVPFCYNEFINVKKPSINWFYDDKGKGIIYVSETQNISEAAFVESGEQFNIRGDRRKAGRQDHIIRKFAEENFDAAVYINMLEASGQEFLKCI